MLELEPRRDPAGKQRATPTLLSVVLKYYIQHVPRSTIDIAMRLPIIWHPQFIVLREPRFEAVLWESGVDVGARPPLVAGMNAIVFAYKLRRRRKHRACARTHLN